LYDVYFVFGTDVMMTVATHEIISLLALLVQMYKC